MGVRLTQLVMMGSTIQAASIGAVSKTARWLRLCDRGETRGKRRKAHRREPGMPTITPFLWFDSQAEEAMNFYASIFKRSKVISINRALGKVMSVQFELEGQAFMALNGALKAAGEATRLRILALLGDQSVPWTRENWQAFLQERARLLQVDEGLPAAQASAR